MENFLSDEQTVGTILRQEREKQCKTIQDVAQATHIRENFLKSIENDHFEELPSKLHISGFLKVYCQYLGLDEQDITSRYKKQMLLLQDLPSEELFAISRISDTKKKRNMIILFSVIIFCILVGGSIALFYHPKTQSSTPDIILDDMHIKNSTTVSKGEEFTFFVKGKQIIYKLLDLTDRSISLLNITTETTIPPFLYTEALEYDLDDNQEYDYMIKILDVEEEKVTFELSLVNVFKNPGQLSYAIVQMPKAGSQQEQQMPDTGVLTIQNESSSKLLIVQVDTKNQTTHLELNPMQDKKIVYFDTDHKALYNSIYIQDLSAVHLNMDGQEILGKIPFSKGAVGIVSCRVMGGKKQPFCRLTSGRYS